jgi:glycerate dehydrogenase
VLLRRRHNLKIVVLDGYTLNPGDLSWEGFESLGDFKVYDRTPLDKIVERIGDAEAIITNKTPVTREILESCPGIKYIGALATGYNVIDTEAAKEKGIPVTNIPTYGTTAVAQFAIALLLEICHNVGDHSNAVYEGRWETCQDFCFWNHPLIELADKTMGFIGFGRIGQATAKIAAALGMKIIAHDSYESDEGRQIAEYVSLDELLSRSDVISLHCPLLPSTQGIINSTNLGKMKDGAIIINTSRGPLIEESALADALNSGKIAAAGLDVVSVEPIKGDNPLLKAKNCFITPHIAWAPSESRKRLMDIAVNNLKSFMDGNAVNVVNSV